MPNDALPIDEVLGIAETEAERARRLMYEAELVARSRVDVAEGRVIPGEAVEAWVSESVRLGRPAKRPRFERPLPKTD